MCAQLGIYGVAISRALFGDLCGFHLLNRPLPNCLLSLCQNESSCETIHVKMSFACRVIFMQIKLIIIGKVFYEDSF